MTLPANIRVNVGAPFPALVKASGPVTVGRANGTWTLGLSPMIVAPQSPAIGSYATDYVLVFDSISNIWFRMPLAQLAGAAPQRAVSTAPVTIGPNDFIVHLNLPIATTIQLPSYLTRNGVPLVFKDVGGNAASQPITIMAAPTESIDGDGTVVLSSNYQMIRVTPSVDGVNTGWFVE